jgi:hypothetical protein
LIPPVDENVVVEVRKLIPLVPPIERIEPGVVEPTPRLPLKYESRFDELKPKRAVSPALTVVVRPAKVRASKVLPSPTTDVF